MVRASTLAALAATGLLVLAGCGGGSSSETAPSRSPSHEYQGGEESIERFGEEARGAPRQAILGSFDTYMSAVGDRDFALACSHLAKGTRASVARLAAGLVEGKGCAATLARLIAPAAIALSARQAEGQIAKVRFEGKRAFVVFKAPGAKLYQLTMVKEGGRWKAGTAIASVLVPEL